MKKFFKTLSIVLCLTMVTPSIVPNFRVETVQAENIVKNQIDVLHEYKLYSSGIGEDDDFDDDDFEDEEEYNYDNVKKTFKKVSISQERGHNFNSVCLEEGKTNIYPIDVKKSAEYIIGMDDTTHGEGAILITDSKGNNVYEKELDLSFKKWKKNIILSKGKYYIKILSKGGFDFDYELYIEPAIVVKKKKKNLKMSSCDKKELNPSLGKGKWTTSNKNVISIITKNPKNSSYCNIRAKKTGKATVTYTNKNGSIIKYKIIVSASSTYPLDRAYFEMDSVGGLQPHILISNNSNKRIKYVYLTVSFYNSVGDKVRNEIGGYTNAKLQITGPVNAWNFKWYEWNPVFYNTTASKMKIETIKIIYFDGSIKNMKINKKYPICW